MPSDDERPIFETPQRLDPKTLVHRLLTSVPAIVLLSYPLFRQPDTAQWLTAAFAIAAGAVTIPWIVISYVRFRFQITPREVLIDKGVLNRQHRSIPIERIQNVEIRRTVLQRALGLCRVRIETAGGSETEGVLQFVSPETAAHIRRVIRAHQDKRRPPAGSHSDDEAGSTHAESALQIPLREILLAGMFRFSLIYIALIFSGLQYFSIQPDQIIEYIAGPNFKDLLDSRQLSYVFVIATSVVAAAVLAWLAGIVVTVNRYFGYAVWLSDGKLYRKHGLLATSEGTVPLRRIQLLRLVSNLPMRLLDRARLDLQTMGVDPSQAGSQVALLLADVSTCRSFGRRLLPNKPFQEPAESVSPLHIRRLFVRRMVVLLTLASAGAYWLSPYVLWSLAAAPLLFAESVARYRRHGYALSDEAVTIRHGLYRLETVLVPYDRIQLLQTSATIFQRRLDLKTIMIDVAGGERFQTQRIVDLPSTTADNLISSLYEEFQRAAERSALSDRSDRENDQTL